jgi:hypothetical protein
LRALRTQASVPMGVSPLLGRHRSRAEIRRSEVLARHLCRERDCALQISHRVTLTRLNLPIVGQNPVKENGEGRERTDPKLFNEHLSVKVD